MSELKHKLLATPDLKTAVVYEWGNDFHVRCMSGQGRSDWGTAWEAYKKKLGLGDDCDVVHYYAVMIVHTACEVDGSLLFSMDDVPELLKKTPASLKTVFDAARSVNGMGKDAVEDAAKN